MRLQAGATSPLGGLLFLMEVVMRHLSHAMFSIGLIYFSVSAAFAQTSDRMLMWPPLPIGRITSAGSGVSLSPVQEAVQIVDISVAGRSITAGEAFAADDD